jgi:dihydroflavonol-4-reductase
MTSLVTGASGFVGGAVVRALIAEGHRVRALVRAGSNLRNLDGLELDICLGDLGDRASLERATRGCAAVFHVAADYRLWVPDPEGIYAVNVVGTRNLMLAAAENGVRRIVYTSSVATLGLTTDGSPSDEATPATLRDMVGHYKRSKFLAEAGVRQMAGEGLPVVIVNPSTPVGPGDVRPTPTGRMIAEAAAGRMPAYVDTGLNVVHVDDVASGHLLALEKGEVGERYILGAENLTLKEILRQLASLTGRRPPRLRLPWYLVLPLAHAVEAWARLSGGGEPLVTVDGVRLSRKRMFFSSKKAERELGFQPRPAREALRDAVEWFRR